MSHSSRYLRAAALGAGVAIGILSAGAPAADAAQKKSAEAAQPQTEASQKQQAAAAAKNNYESGVKQYQAGKYAPAVENLSAALRGGGLASGEMARALYIRGLAYKKQSKPGLAISDLTSALWLKNGLNDADRANATAERAEAYRQAGLGDGNSGVESVAVADPNAGAAAAPPPASAPGLAPAPAVVAETKPAKKKGKKDEAALAPPVPAPEPVAEITRQAPDSEAAQDAARARKLAAAPVDAGGLTSVASQTLTGAGASPAAAAAPAPAVPETTLAAVAPAPAPAAAPVIAPMAAPAAASAPAVSAPPADAPVLSAAPIEQTPATPDAAAGTSSSPIGKFFSNLFSGSSTAQPAPAADPVTTASTTPTAATSSWNDQTSVANGVAKDGAVAKGVKQAAAGSPPAAAPAVVKAGKYKIHIAAVRSRQEAEAIAQKVQTENGAALKSRTASVDEAVIGSMGTFYRVRVGSFANADEPRSVCNSLRTSGFDCLVVTN